MITIYDTLLTLTESLQSRHPDCIRITHFGNSYVGRRIPALQLGDGYGHRLLYVGGITGDLRSAALLLRFARDFAEAAGEGRRIAGIDISYLLHTRTVTVVPLLNPDGAVLRLHGEDESNPLLERLSAHRARKPSEQGENPFADLVTNGRGVDLRANCDADFDECVSASNGIGFAHFPGMHPESEPECAAVCRYLRAQPTTDLTLLFDDEEGGGSFGRITYAGGDNSCGGDRRVAGIASILARDIDAQRCITGISEPAGGFARWYRTLDAGPLLEVSVPGLSGDDATLFSQGCGEGDLPEIFRTLLSIAAGTASEPGETSPGTALLAAEFALGYAKIRRALFHGAVL